MRNGGFGAVIDQSLPAVLQHLASIDVEPAGPPLVIYRVIDMAGDLRIEVGFPVAGEVASGGQVTSGSLPVGRYVVGTHVGPYDGLQDANAELQRWAEEQGLRWEMQETPDGDRFQARFELYLTDPQARPDPAKWETEIAYLLA